MGLNVRVASPVATMAAGLYPVVQDNRWITPFPFPHNEVLTSGPMSGADSWARSPASAQPANSTNGVELKGFAGDWYNRIHVTPNDVDVGNLMSQQTYDITVWNAFFEPVQLLSINESADAGTNLDVTDTPPFFLSPLEPKVYTLSISTSGPPVVDSSYQFNFVSVVIELKVRGNRVVVWPFSPQQGVTETLEWKTDVIRAKSGEQRIALRDYPRQGFAYKTYMNDREMTIARAMAVGWAHRQFGVPVWTDATFIGTVPSGTTYIEFDTSNADYRVDGTLIVWQDNENYMAAGIDDVSSSGITLKVPTAITLTGAFVMPMSYARASSVKISRAANKLAVTDVDFNVTLNANLGASIGLPVFKGLDVLTDTMHYLGGYEETIEKKVTVLDGGLGNISVTGQYTTTDQGFFVCWALTNRADLWRVKRWLYTLKGKQKAFWLPASSEDLELVLDANSTGAQSIQVRSINYQLYYQERAIEILRNDGTKTYHYVTGGTTVGGIDTLSFDAAIGVEALISNVRKISFMHKVRLDADRVEIRHEDSGYVTIKVPVTEVVN